MVVLPGVEQLLDVIVNVGVVELTKESLRVLLHLLGGQHLYKLNVIEVWQFTSIAFDNSIR